MVILAVMCYNNSNSSGDSNAAGSVMLKTGGIYQWQTNIVTFSLKVMLT